MTIIRPDQLFDQADMLIHHSGGQQVALRRAVSAAYYGLFHTATIAVADYVVGSTRRSAAEWSLAARSIGHDDLRDVCNIVEKPIPPLKYRPYIPSALFGYGFKAYCRAVVELREKRHDADYNPLASFYVADVRSIVGTARTANERFRGMNDDERRVFVCLLLFRPR